MKNVCERNFDRRFFGKLCQEIVHNSRRRGPRIVSEVIQQIHPGIGEDSRHGIENVDIQVG